MKTWIVLMMMMTMGRASAGFLVEPYLGYKTGSYEFDVTGVGAPNDGTYKYDFNGLAIGARLGYTMMGFMGGLHLEKGNATAKKNSVPTGSTLSTDAEDKYNTTNIGVFVGYNLPIMMRVWASYFFNAEIQVSESNTVSGADKDDLYSGSGFSLGAGYTGLPFVSLNLEYRMVTLNELEDGVTGVKTSFPTANLSEYDIKEIIFSVSLPLDL